MHFNQNIYQIAKENADFRRVLATGDQTQVVVMRLPSGEEFTDEAGQGEQVLVIVRGCAKIVMNGAEDWAGPDSLVFLPRGSRYKLVNTGTQDLRFYLVYGTVRFSPHTVEPMNPSFLHAK